MESIEEYEEKSKPVLVPGLFQGFLESPYWVMVVLLLVAISAFALGRFYFYSSQKEPVQVINTSVSSSSGQTSGQNATATEASRGENKTGEVVGSKNSTKYHLPSCPGAKQISEKNKIVFTSPEAARQAGYSPAANCPGLQ